MRSCKQSESEHKMLKTLALVNEARDMYIVQYFLLVHRDDRFNDATQISEERSKRRKSTDDCVRKPTFVPSVFLLKVSRRNFLLTRVAADCFAKLKGHE